MNKGIDWFLNKIIKMGGGNRIIKSEEHNFSFVVILKKDLSKNDAELELQRIMRLKKLKRII